MQPPLLRLIERHLWLTQLQIKIYQISTPDAMALVGGEAALALPPGSLEQKPASGAPLFLKNGASSRLLCSGVPPSKIGNRPSTVPSIVKVMLAFTL
jgi:hypothetical protein